MNQPFRTRIRAVRFKSGGELRLLPSPREALSRDVAQWLRKEVEVALENHGDYLAGCAIIVWTCDGDSGAAVRNTMASPLPTTAVPGFCAAAARKVLTQDQIDRRLGYEDDDEAS